MEISPIEIFLMICFSCTFGFVLGWIGGMADGTWIGRNEKKQDPQDHG